MDKEKKLIEEIRENCRLLQTKVEALKDSNIDISIEIGTDKKTVLFDKLKHIEIEVRATLNIEI